MSRTLLSSPRMSPSCRVPASGASKPHAACTHMTMTRLFDTCGSFRCSMCHNHPKIGWVYRCTQDTNGVLPASDFVATSHESTSTSRSQDFRIHSLSPSIIDAIQQGQYTAEQINIVIAQKKNVRDIIIAQEPRAITPTSSSEGSVNASTIADNTTSTSLASVKIDSTFRNSAAYQSLAPITLEDELNAYDENNSLHILKSDEGCPLITNAHAALQAIINQPIVTHFPPCNWTCCQACRPTYRDRAYQRLDEVINKPYQPPPPWDLANRRVSDARVVAHVGLPKLQRYYGPYAASDLRSELSQEWEWEWDDEGGYWTAPRQPQSQPQRYRYRSRAAPEYAHRSDRRDHSVRRKSGFRETVRKALSRAVVDSNSSLRSHNQAAADSSRDSSRNSSQESLFSRSMLFMRRKMTPPPPPSGPVQLGTDGDVAQLHESLMLVTAMQTPLPEAAEGEEEHWVVDWDKPNHADTVACGEAVEVEDGVAVTEEGVTMSAADIIIQA